MADWGEIIKTLLEEGKKVAPEVASKAGDAAGSIDDLIKNIVEKVTGGTSVDVAKMSKAERSAANKAANAANQAASSEASAMAGAARKQANKGALEDIIKTGLTPQAQTKFAQQGFQGQLNEKFAKINLGASEKAIFKKVEDTVMAEVAKMKEAGTAYTKEDIKKLISDTTTEVSKTYKERAAGAEQGLTTRMENLKTMTPEEVKLSGTKAGLVQEKITADRAGQRSTLRQMEAKAKSKDLFPVLDKDGKQVMVEVTGKNGEKTMIGKTETALERDKRLSEVKMANPIGSEGKGKVVVKGESNAVPSEMGPKLTAAQEANALKGAKMAAANAESPAAKAALAQIEKDYSKGVIDKKRYLELLGGVPSIKGKAVSAADVAALEKSGAAASAKSAAAMAEAEKAAAAFKSVPKTELKGMKWVRDKSGKLVLAKK